jgi:ribose transport system substrate-binding protein
VSLVDRKKGNVVRILHRKLITGSFAFLTVVALAACTASSDKPTATSGTAAAGGATAVSSAGGACTLPAGFKAGIAIREMVNDVDRDVVNGAKETFEAAGATVTVTDAGGDALKQNDNIESLINSGVNGLLPVLGDSQQVSALTKKATDSGIKVASALFGVAPQGALTDVGYDDPLASSLMTRALFSSIGYKGDVYVFWVPGAPILETRKRVMEAIAADYPQIKLHEVPTEHGAAKSLSQMTDILTANPQKGSIAGVWGAYDLLVSGANEAVKRAGRDEIKVTSIDGDKVAFQMLYGEKSPFVATVVGDVKSVGRLAAEAIIKASCGQAAGIPIATYTPLWVATRNNGIEAGEKRWGADLWKSSGLDKAAIEKQYTQDQTVVVSLPTLPE